jgi:hypothetical protein
VIVAASGDAWNKGSLRLIAATPDRGPVDFSFGGASRSKEPSGVDRRSTDRFPIEREVRFKLLGKRNSHEEGVGKTVNISSNGILFTTDKALVPGRRIEVSISWPAQLDDRCQLKLVAKGRITRQENGRAAIEIQQYEFRTAGRG